MLKYNLDKLFARLLGRVNFRYSDIPRVYVITYDFGDHYQTRLWGILDRMNLKAL